MISPHAPCRASWLIRTLRALNARDRLYLSKETDSPHYFAIMSARLQVMTCLVKADEFSAISQRTTQNITLKRQSWTLTPHTLRSHIE